MSTINTRITHKHDTEYNWINFAPDFVPYKGEMIIYDAETGETQLPEGRTEYIPYPRYKFGDGVTMLKYLPFSSSIIRMITWEDGD